MMRNPFLLGDLVLEADVFFGAVSVTSTMALPNATLPYVVQTADKDEKKAPHESHGIKTGLNPITGRLTYKGVADAFNLDYTPVKEVLL